MNRLCKLCDGKYDFSSLEIIKCLNEISIGFAGGSRKADNDRRFKFCPACGEKLSRENFNGKDVLEEDTLEEVLKDKFQKYAQSHSDVKSVYFKQNKFILVVDNVTDDLVSQHYDLCFSILDKHNEIEDFEIFDIEEFEVTKDKYSQYSKLYERGANKNYAQQ